MAELAHAALAFAETLWVTRRGRSRASFLRWQARQLDHWLRHDLPRVDFYADSPPQLSALPVIDKAIMMGDFAAFNRGRITAEQGWAALESDGQIGNISIGASTGTSGNRALFAITGPERFRWLGTILAKTIPGFLLRPERVAVLLPRGSVLYDAANRTSRITLRFFDLREGPERWIAGLEAFAPTTIVAPPRVLRHLAEQKARIAPNRLYSGGETLDPVDRAVIERGFGVMLGQIYMATEGLFGVTCTYGKLHLAEDANHFELQPVGDGLVSPLVTSFRRRFQIMARYRMTDLLRLSDGPCACGSPLLSVDEVVGRMDDAFLFDRDGAQVLITPDILRNAVLDAARDITDFRIRREGADRITLALRPDVPHRSAQAARDAMQALLAARGLSPKIDLRREDMLLDTGRKLRRVENLYRG